MELLSGRDRRARWIASGTEACRGQLIDVRGCEQPAAYSSFQLASDCGAALNDGLGTSSSGGKSLTAKVSLKLCDQGDDIAPLLTTASSCPRVSEAHANQRGIWVSLDSTQLPVGLPMLGCLQRRCLLGPPWLQASRAASARRLLAVTC